MRYAPALPIFQLMPAVGSLMVPVATSLVAGLPENFLTPARYAAFSLGRGSPRLYPGVWARQ